MADSSPLHDSTARAGAQFAEGAGWLMPARYGAVEQEYLSARGRAALLDVSHRSKVEVAGPDARVFLQNLSTNDVAGLAPGSGCELFFTTVQAKVVAHALVWLPPGTPPGYWLDAVPGLADRIVKHLDRYLISEQVELADRTRDFAQLHVAGPEAAALLGKVVKDGLPVLRPLQVTLADCGAGPTCQVRRSDALGVPGFDFICPAAEAPSVWDALVKAGAAPAGLEAYELLRVEAGTPAYGKDIDENNLALEVGRTAQAVCYTKGCFLGQEPLVRIRDLGHVNRTLVGLTLPGREPPPAGRKLFRAGKEVGQVTSSVVSPARGTAIALAYVRRGSTDPGTELEVEPAGSGQTAVVAGLPFGAGSGSGAGR